MNLRDLPVPARAREKDGILYPVLLAEARGSEDA